MTTCPCCNTTGLERDDFASASLYKDGWLDALAKKYGGAVCDWCADLGNMQCVCCGSPVMDGEHVETSTGEAACSVECYNEFEAERVEAAAHEKSEKHGWEQV
jgi:hypothetical protein